MQRRRKILPIVRSKSKSVMPDTEVTDMKKQADRDMFKQLLQMCSLHSGCRGDHTMMMWKMGHTNKTQKNF